MTRIFQIYLQYQSPVLFFIVVPCRRADPCEGVQCPRYGRCVVKNGVGLCDCSRNCSSTRSTVCGTNGELYHNLCMLKKTSCERNEVVAPVDRQQCLQLQQQKTKPTSSSNEGQCFFRLPVFTTLFVIYWSAPTFYCLFAIGCSLASSRISFHDQAKVECTERFDLALSLTQTNNLSSGENDEMQYIFIIVLFNLTMSCELVNSFSLLLQALALGLCAAFMDSVLLILLPGLAHAGVIRTVQKPATQYVVRVTGQTSIAIAVSCKCRLASSVKTSVRLTCPCVFRLLPAPG